MEEVPSLPLQVFYGYAREDEELRGQLEKHLNPLRIQGWIDSWYDRDIRPGIIWKPEIVRHLKTANIILLLISPDFMNSGFAFNIETKIAVKRHNEGNTWVVPVILRSADWKNAPFGKLPALPKNGKPVMNWDDMNEAFEDVARGIGEIVRTLLPRKIEEFIKEEGNLSTNRTHTDVSNEQKKVNSTAAQLLQEKRAVGSFDVFLCHNHRDKSKVKEIGEYLKERGILPWLDEWELRPGVPWQRLLEDQIEQIKSAAVFIGTDGLGPWQEEEIDAFLREFVRRRCPVIPVILKYAPTEPRLPIFLRAHTWVDFRQENPDPWKQLVWGITGMRDTSSKG